MQSKFLLSLILCLWLSPVMGSDLVWESTESFIEMAPDEEEVRASFKVTNTGNEAVRISRIKTSCGCTGSVVDQERIAPGESSEIIGTFNKGNRQGTNRNRLQVFIDSQPDPVATLTMEVKIPSLIEVMPRVIYWNSRTSESPRRVALNIDPRYVDQITRIDYDDSKLTVREEAGNDAESGERLLFIEPLDYGTPYRGSITVQGKGPDRRVVEAKVHVFVQN